MGVVGAGVNLLTNPGFRYGTAGWTYTKPTSPMLGGGIASSASDTLADGDIDPGGAARFPHDYVNGTDAALQTFGWDAAPVRAGGKVTATATGPGKDCAWQFVIDQGREYERVVLRCAMRNPTGGGTPTGLVYILPYAADGSLLNAPDFDGSILLPLPDSGEEVRFDTSVVLPHVEGASSWQVRFGMHTSTGLPADFPQGWELTEAQVELGPLAGQTFVVSPTVPSGQVAPRAWANLAHDRVPVVVGSTYSARGLVASRNDLVQASFQLNVYAIDGTQTRTVYAIGREPPIQLGPIPDPASWDLRRAQVTILPGEAFVGFVYFVGTPDNVAGGWRVWFDQAGLYEGLEPDDWEPVGNAALAQLDYPELTIGGTRGYEALARSASWQLGRSWWFGGPEAGTASCELDGDREEIAPGQQLVISRGNLGQLWQGVVDDVTVEERVEDGEVRFTTRVSAADATAWLPGTKLAGVAFSAQPLDARLVALYAKAGATVTTRVMPSTGAIVNIGAGTIGTAAAPVTALDETDRQERGANAISQLGPDGVLRVLVRAALPSDYAGVTPPVPLVGDDCPVSAQLDRAAVGKVVNVWRFTDGEEPYTTPLPDGGTSAQRFGVREYDTRVAKASGTRYTASMRTAVAQALPSHLVAVSVRRREQPVLGLGPFDLVKWRDSDLQVLQLAHQVSPGSWEVTLALDATQTTIAGEVAPPPPVVTRKRATLTLTANADGYAVLTNGGLKAGNGASGNILVGRLADGHLCRGFVGFASQTFLGRNRKVVSATLKLTTNRGACMSWGSSPKFTVKRVTGTWSQGSHATECSFTSSNALVYPGPTVTSTGAVTTSFTAGDNKAVSTRIDAIAQAWLDGQAQRGVGLYGYSESSSANRCAFDASGSGRAQLVLVYEYDE